MQKLMSTHGVVLVVATIAAIFISANAQAVIFGRDDREEVRANPVFQKLARATATQVALPYIQTDANGRLNFEFPPLTSKETWSFCSDERFANQPASPIACTAFLVAPDLLVTAGHCAVNWAKVKNEVTPQCSSFAWLFDYQTDSNGNVATNDVSADKLVHCKQVVYANQVVDYDKKTDHNTYHEDIALIQIDRAITDREPLKLSLVNPVLGERLAAIGYPLGLPAKSVSNAKVLENTDSDYIKTDLDVSGGNSGSPVFNSKGEVIGVVVRAFPDPESTHDKTNSCERWLKCSADLKTCDEKEEHYSHSTEVQRIQAVLPYLKN